MANPLKWLLEKPLNIDPSKAGKTLLGLNAIGMAAAAASDTVAAAIDKDTSAEDKKFLVPAGVATGIAKIGIYFTMTTAIIDKLQGKIKYNKDGGVKKCIKGLADSVLEEMVKADTLQENALKYLNKVISKAEKGFLGTGLFKKSDEYIQSMKEAFFEAGGELTQTAIESYKSNLKSGFGVLGAFIGAVVGSAILAPIIRDVSAWAIQKMREKKNPELKELPYTPYFGPLGTRMGYSTKNQPLSMKNYMTFAQGGNLKV